MPSFTIAKFSAWICQGSNDPVATRLKEIAINHAERGYMEEVSLSQYIASLFPSQSTIYPNQLYASSVFQIVHLFSLDLHALPLPR